MVQIVEAKTAVAAEVAQIPIRVDESFGLNGGGEATDRGDHNANGSSSSTDLDVGDVGVIGRATEINVELRAFAE